MNSRKEWHYVENLRAYMCFTFTIEDDVDDNNEYGNAIKLSRFAFVFVLSKSQSLEKGIEERIEEKLHRICDAVNLLLIIVSNLELCI